ncbi:Iron-sulfur cluster carrier protein (fragment) [Hyella patelloides LEGE 07179]|uniref:Iron-sulfur cluster carrier protein n=1 Tax=Hyella patelloides LEGE 07179 TaxID=945734 RepID=A0A563VXP6_9CYAN
MFSSTLDEVPTKTLTHKLQYNHQRIEGIKNIIAISSGRDRVGKNTIAVNIAVKLAQIGSKVGLLDADPNNLNVSNILGLKDPYIPVSGGAKGERFEPVNNFGVKLVSIASLLTVRSI